MAEKKITVYVPAKNTPLRHTIHPYSGIVGTPAQTAGYLVIDYEGNLYGAANVKTLADRVEVAAGRHAIRYPTVARAHVRAEDMIPVGMWDEAEGKIHLIDEEPLKDWLEVEAVEPDELYSTSHRHVERRMVREALSSPDPMTRMQAELYTRRNRRR